MACFLVAPLITGIAPTVHKADLHPRGLSTLPASEVGWEEVFNSGNPLGRTASAACAGDWGIMGFGGGLHEHRFTDETWLLPKLGGTWRRLMPEEGRPYPVQRAVTGLAKYRNGCIMFGGTSRTQGTNTSMPRFSLLNDTWFWTPEEGWVELAQEVAPPGRFYHTLKELSDGTLFLYGGRVELFGTREYSRGDTWVFADGAWSRMNLLTQLPPTPMTPHMPASALLRNEPQPRWGHAMACSLTNTGPAMMSNATGWGKVECVMFGGSQTADEDYLDDTWLLRVATHRNGTELVPRTYFWEQQNSRTTPHGRWCFMMATCGSRAIFIGGSTDFRVSADETWMWSPVTRNVDLPAHPPGRLGEWTRLYGTDPMEDADWGGAERPAAAGPRRPAGYALFNLNTVGSSDIIFYAGAINQEGGTFTRKGWETAQMYRWPCGEDTWPEAMVASPPAPPLPPPPPDFPPGEYGGKYGIPVYLEPPEERPPQPNP